MSKIVAGAAIRGAKKLFTDAKSSWENAVKEKGPDCEIAFPGTAFYFPMAYALLGLEVKKLKDIQPVLEESESLLHEEPSEKLWLPYLGDALDSGIAALFCEEIICALRYLYGKEPQSDCEGFLPRKNARRRRDSRICA